MPIIKMTKYEELSIQDHEHQRPLADVRANRGRQWGQYHLEHHRPEYAKNAHNITCTMRICLIFPQVSDSLQDPANIIFLSQVD